MTINKQPAGSDDIRVNHQIRSPQVRVIGADGEMLGIMSSREAQRVAEDAGLDLLEISPNAAPPVCKIADYGKYRYELQKKAAAAKKNQKTVEIKELQIRPTIEEHDYQVKLRAAQRWLEDGDKVKVTLRYRGREMEHQEIGMEVIKRLKEDLLPFSKVESDLKMEGKQVMLLLGPK